MNILVFLEHHDSEISKGSLGVLTKAASLTDSEVAGVLVGSGPMQTLATEAGKFGATKVYVAESDELGSPLPQPRVDVLEQIITNGSYDIVLFSNSVLTADTAAALSARIDAGLNWDLADLVDHDGTLVGKRPALADSVLVDVAWRSDRRLALFRSGSFDAVPIGGADPAVEPVSVTLQPHSTGATIVSQNLQQDSGPSIEDAEVVVAGGMGLGAAEHFSIAEELAGLLGGVVGATRAAVYAGWYPYAAQVGQTGKTVSPKLYIALGISGAIQHKVGMQNAKVIVSINKDANAPIFEFSDLAVVGDVHTVAPQLIELLRQRKGS
jgi:electron transfer flavoprotein alpha subunit